MLVQNDVSVPTKSFFKIFQKFIDKVKNRKEENTEMKCRNKLF